MGMLGERLTVDTGPGMAKQSFANEVDINKIIAGYEKTGMIQHLNTKEPFYGDVSKFRSYQECLDLVQEADSLFQSMDARVRERFKNDPVEMVSFLDDPKNLDEAVTLGMVVRRPQTGQGGPKDEDSESKGEKALQGA